MRSIVGDEERVKKQGNLMVKHIATLLSQTDICYSWKEMSNRAHDNSH